MDINALRALPKAESIRAMEVLWESLTDGAGADDVVPAWHQQVLIARLAQLEAGGATPIPWEDAKERLRVLSAQSRSS